MRGKNWITLSIIVIILIISIMILTRNINGVSKSLTACIANHSTLYVQLGCHACAIQEEIFGDNYQYLNKIDCFLEGGKCGGITNTPTWIINGEKYLGVQSIERLKELTGC